MQTKTAGPGRFASFDLTAVPSPSFVTDLASLEENLAVLKQVADQSGAQILTALKAFSLWSAAPLVSRYLNGACASGLYEARLARAHYVRSADAGIVSCFAPAYKPQEIAELADICDHIIFNSPQQIVRFAAQACAGGAEIGLRINPGLPLGEVEKYDPSAPRSRLGLPINQLDDDLFNHISGLHIHSLCEQGFEELARLVEVIRPLLDRADGRLSWLNLGGGHMITAPDYDRAGLVACLTDLRQTYQLDIYLEPGTAIAFDAGILVGEVLDVMDNDGPVAILDISATCHMPDVLEAPYRPGLLAESETGPLVRLGGPSCLAGDVIGDYRFDQIPVPGQRLAFLDQAHYSMVKTTMFNGVPLPALALWDSRSGDLSLVREFSYADFESRLS